MADQTNSLNQIKTQLTKLGENFGNLPKTYKALAIGGGLTVIALAATLLFSGGKPEYRVLFSQLPDKDGGQVIASLQQANIPYSLEHGGIISVPAEQLYDARMKLAAQGLPKASGLGFELMDNQKFGISQFAEQVNYQRSIEGELARSIESLAAVDSARVHLAIPKQTVFVRDQQHPTASVILNLHSGRTLSSGQISGIIHLVSSSIPNMLATGVTVVDQDGNMISSQADLNSPEGLNQKQMSYVKSMEQDYVRRIESILEPMFGPGNIRAQVTLNLDFSEFEQTSENYKPNTDGNPGAMRSQQVLEDSSPAANVEALGVPGALSNQPPSMAEAPIALSQNSDVAPGNPVIAGQQQSGTASNQANRNRAQQNTNLHRETLTNYEIDRTIQHTKRTNGTVRRLTAAVVVNNRWSMDKESGESKSEALTPEEIKQVERLVQEAIGFNEQRGDSVNVVNTTFANSLLNEKPKSKFEQFAEQLDGKLGEWIKYGLLSLLALYIIFGIIRPILKRVLHLDEKNTGVASSQDLKEPSAREIASLLAQAEQLGSTPSRINPGQLINLSVGDQPNDVAMLSNAAGMRLARSSANIELVKELMKSDPRTAAQIIKEWVNRDE